MTHSAQRWIFIHCTMSQLNATCGLPFHSAIDINLLWILREKNGVMNPQLIKQGHIQLERTLNRISGWIKPMLFMIIVMAWLVRSFYLITV